MESLVTAINNLGQRAWIDYIAIFSPIVLSVVAVWVSMATARKQNKIELFEKRYKVYTLLMTIIQIQKTLVKMKKKDYIVLDEKARARRYFMFCWEDKYYQQVPLKFHALYHEGKLYGYEVEKLNNEPLNLLLEEIVSDILKSMDIIQQYIFLFPKNTHECLHNIGEAYKKFMLSLVRSCNFTSENNTYEGKGTKLLELEWEYSDMEEKRKIFQEAIDIANKKQIIKQIQNLLQL